MVATLPSAIEAEKGVLGAILLENDLAVDATAKLDVEKFSLDAHRRIFRHMVELSDAGKPIDALMLSDSMTRSGELKQIGGIGYISELTEGVPRRSSIEHYIKLIRDKWILRSIMQTADAALARCGTDEPSEILGDIEAQLLELRAERTQRAEAHLSTFIGEVAERLHDKRTEELVGFTTGIGSIDRATTGIRCGELWIIGALPGRGKTAVGAQIAVANASQGHPTMFFSLEMTREQLAERMISPESGVVPTKIRKRWLDANEKRLVREAAERMMGWSLYVDDSADLTDRELMARAKLAIRRYGTKLIIVDYLRLLKCPGKELRERVGEAANTLRKLAKQENVAVVGLSQLRRPEDINNRPSMIDLKESGDIEAHAHTVLLMYQPLDKTGKFTGEDEIIIGKQRNGPLGSEPVTFKKDTLTFEERL